MLPPEDRNLLTQAMVGLNVDPETITTLMASFDATADGVESDPISPAPGSSFGESYTGGYRLATNAAMAHQAAAEELRKIAAGMRGMAEAVAEFDKDIHQTTEQTVATANLMTASTECVAAPTFNGGSCSLTDDSEG